MSELFIWDTSCSRLPAGKSSTWTMQNYRRVDEAEDKHTEKSCTGTDKEQGLFKAAFSAKLKGTKDYDKGIPMFNNFNVIRFIMSTVKHARSA